MTKINCFSLTLVLTVICTLLTSAQAQTSQMTTVNISAQSDKVHLSAEGAVSEMRVEVSDEQGEVVFQSGAISGNTLDWKMTDAQGERVSPGTYLVTVTFHTAAGKLRKRVEQVTVAEDEKSSTKQTAAPEAVQATITGAGTTNKIAKFTGASTIGDSVITESAGKVGIGTAAPTSTLTVSSTAANAAAIVASGNAAGGIGVKGGSNNETGIGVWGVHTATTGTTPGVKGETSSAGDGAVGVLGVVNSTTTGYQATAVRGTNKGKFGYGVWGEQLGKGTGVYGSSISGDGVNASSNSGTGVVATSISGTAVDGESASGDGVYGYSYSGYAGHFDGKTRVNGNLEIDDHGNESFGAQTRQMINLYQSIYGIGVQHLTFYYRSNSGYAWYKGGSHSDTQNDPGGGTLLMKLGGAGNLTVTGSVTATNIMPTSDRNMKANFSTVNPRSVLDRLAAIPIQTWNYKSEGTSVRHIGPTAQDFRSAFNLGMDDKHISTVDADGVTMAAIQGLYQQNQELMRKVGQLQARVTQLEHTNLKRRASRRR